MTVYDGCPYPPADLVMNWYALEVSDKLGFDLFDTYRIMTDEMAEKLAQVVGQDKEYWLTCYKVWDDFSEGKLSDGH